jgi:excisionase family DNA binding protein
MPTQLLTVEQVASRLALRPATIRKMLYRRQLTAIRPTKRAIRIAEAEVEALARVGLLRLAQEPGR